MPSISFFQEGVDFPFSNQQKTADWISSIAHQESFKIARINYIFCSDEYLHQINLQYLSHDTYTDILTFDQSDKPDEIECDIYISIERVSENALTHKDPFDHELRRVMVHGVLHLMGYTDKTSEDKQVMREKEDSCLSLYPI